MSKGVVVVPSSLYPRSMQDSDRNYYLSAPQAVEYGLVDEVLSAEEAEALSR